MRSIDKLRYWDLIRELSPAEICELADKLVQLKDLLGLGNDDEPGNETAVDEACPLCAPQANDAPLSDVPPQVNGATKRVRNRPDKPYRLTAEEKFEILERHSFGETQVAIAEAMGRSQLTVGRFIRSQAEKNSDSKTV